MIVAEHDLYTVHQRHGQYAVAQRTADDHRVYYVRLSADDARVTGVRHARGRIEQVWDYLPKGATAAEAIARADLLEGTRAALLSGIGGRVFVVRPGQWNHGTIVEEIDASGTPAWTAATRLRRFVAEQRASGGTVTLHRSRGRVRIEVSP